MNLITSCSLRFVAAGLLAVMALPVVSPAQDDADPPPRERRGADENPPPRPFNPAMLLDRLRPRLDELNLTEDQKTKIDEIFTITAEDLKPEPGQDEADRRARGEEVRQAMMDLRTQVLAVLNDEQKPKFEEMMAAMRQRGQGGPGEFIEQFKAAIPKLDLSEEQKSQIQTLMSEKEKEIQALREQGGDAREEFRAAMRDLHEELDSILTPEQREKLRDLLPPPPPDGRDRHAGQDEPRRRRPPPGNDDPADK